MIKSSQSNYFPTIDVLRGFAAISVVVHHVIEIFGWKDFPTEGLLVWFRIGWMGVDLFFRHITNNRGQTFAVTTI